jgi:hypothetical protein
MQQLNRDEREYLLKTAGITPSFLEKIAAKWWKRLSDGAFDSLASKGILDTSKIHAIESAGINRGNHELVRKLGIKTLRGSEENMKNMFHEGVVKNKGLYEITKKQFEQHNIPENIRALTDPQATSMAGYGFGGVPHTRTIAVKSMNNSSLNGDFSGLNRQDTIHARRLITRHEIDEIRHGVRTTNKSSFKFDGKPVSPLTTMNGHMSPAVVMDEGKNVAGASRALRGAMKDLRSQTPDLDTLSIIAPDYGYGKNVGKLNYRAAEKALIPKNRSMFKPSIDNYNEYTGTNRASI